MNRKNPLKTADYARLAAFRYALRSFLHFAEAAASRAGLTSQQYQAMLYVRSRGEEPVSINDLANELLIKHNSAVGLTDRLVTQGLMERSRAEEDRRRVRLALTPRGALLVGQVANVSRRKLRQAGPDIHRVVGELASVWERD